MAPEAPLYGVTVGIDRVVLGELVIAMGMQAGPPPTAQTLESMSSVVLDDAMRGCVERLLQCLHDPLESRIMGPARVRELLFTALRGPRRMCCVRWWNNRGSFRASPPLTLNHLHAHYAEPLNIETLAGFAHMSASTFHEHFKRCTLLSPVQYLKRLRLLKAQQLLLVEGMSVAQAAHKVGYQSTSQFSREYKRYFLHQPRRRAGRLTPRGHCGSRLCLR